MHTVHYMPIPDYPNYEIGDDGNIRKEIFPGVWRALQVVKNRDGYMVVTLVQSGEQTQFRVNRLVLLAFVGPPPEGQVACHANGIRFDNRLDNLRWDTDAGNEADKIRHGTTISGERNHLHKLTVTQVQAIKALILRDVPLSDIAKTYGVSRTAIYFIKIGHTWAGV